MDLSELCMQVKDLLIEVGRFIEGEHHKIKETSIQNKGVRDFVTYVDKTAEEKLIEGLEAFFPEAGFIAEEGTKSNPKEYSWIIDPLDGTTNYIHGAPPYAISVGLMHDNVMIMGHIFEISLKESFYAWKGSPAYLNGKEIHVSSCSELSASLIATGFPYENLSRTKPFMETLSYLFENTHGVRRLGSAATDLAYVACGRYDAFYEYNLKPWDVAAGAFIVQQAGGAVCDFSGGNNYIFGKEIITGSAALLKTFQPYIQSIMNTQA